MESSSVWRSSGDQIDAHLDVQSLGEVVREKRETLIYTDGAKGYWEILTFSKAMMKTCDRMYVAREEFEEDGVIYGKYYEVPKGCVVVRKPPK